VKKLAPHRIFEKNTIRFTRGEEADLEQIKRNLFFMGYERAAFIESKGQYSVRGGIVDIFPADAEYPYG
jgi:transcription-repair coupling factor (superfamily II helicase)